MFCQRKGHGLLRRPSRVRSSMGFYQGGLKAQPFDLFAMRNEPGEVISLSVFLLNQCEGHNQDASKTTPSYIALMPFQAPSRLLRELIQLAAREPQTSPAELIHTRSKERERILSKGRGSGRKRERERASPFLCHDPHSARHTDFISQRAFTHGAWSVPKNLVGRLLQLQLKSSRPCFLPAKCAARMPS